MTNRNRLKWRYYNLITVVSIDELWHGSAVAVLALRCRNAPVPRRDGAHLPKPSTKEDKEMKALFNRFVREDSGQDLIEYGLLIGIITAGAITAIGLIGPKVKSYYENLQTALP